MHSEDRYRRAAAAGGVGIWEWNVATNEIYVDPVLKEILGYQDDEICGDEEVLALVHPDDQAMVVAWAREHMAGQGLTPELEHRMRHRDGTLRWFVLRASVTRDDKGAPTRMSGTETDITARKRSEEALRHSEEVNKRIVASTGDCVKILDFEGRLIYINPEGLRQLELDGPDLLLNKPFGSTMQEAHRLAALEAVECARSGITGRFQTIFRTASGIVKWFDVVVTPINDARGEVVQFLAISRDITERRREEGLRTIFNQVLGMLATGSALGDVLNRLARVIEEQSEDMRCSILLLDDDGLHVRHGAAPSLPAAYVRAVDGSAIGPSAGSCGTAMFLGSLVVAADISIDPRWAPYRSLALEHGLRACWSMPIMSAQKRVLGSFAMYYDAPRVATDEEIRLMESVADLARIAIEQQRAELEANTQRRELAHLGRVATVGELTGTMAHELSQPLAAVRMNAQAARHLMDQTPLDVGELKAALDDIIRDNTRAGAVIDHLRALLRKEALALQPVNLNEVVREVVDLSNSEVRSRRISVTSALASEAPVVMGDRVQLQQVVLNLVLNACDAMSDTPAARRKLAVATAIDNGFVRLAVSDNGVGIPADRIEQVFEPFVTFRPKGLGLGLAISRSIVTAHRGTITAENKADGGATFRCVLPRAAS